MMRMAAKVTVAGVAGYAVLSLVTALVGPAVAFMMAILWMLLKISLIILVGYVVLSLLRKRNEADEDTESETEASADAEPSGAEDAAEDDSDSDDDEPEVIDAEVVE